MHDIDKTVLIHLPRLFGIDLSITNEVLLLWLTAGVTFLLLSLAFRRRSPVAHGVFQNIFEGLYDFVDRNIVRENLGVKGATWTPLLATLFFFILFGNLMGMVPDPHHFKAVTSNLSVTVALAAIVYTVVITVDIRRNGLKGFLLKFIPQGLPRGVGLLVMPIEIISWLAKPVSLAIRLFANMMAGHALLLIFISLQVTALWYLKALPLIGAVAMACFELFVSFIQAFIFTMLAGIYISDAISSHKVEAKQGVNS